MKFTTITISALSIIASATQAHARRRHLNDIIKGEESDASMSMLSPARGGGSKSKSASVVPTPAPIPEPKPGECNSIIDSSDVINTGGVFTLQKDILNCDCGGNGFALKVDGQGTVVKLNGYTVECKTFTELSFPAGIKVIGTANTVMGPGTVKGGGSFSNGILLSVESGGFHTVNGVTIGPDVGTGISVSNDNTIINNFITETERDGVNAGIVTKNNIIKDNTIVKAGGVGIRIDGVISFIGTSVNNQILDNTIIASGREGVSVRGKRNVVQGNTINKSGVSGFGGSGIKVDSTFISNEDVIIKGNSITNSKGAGIEITAGSSNRFTAVNTVVIGNKFAGNTDGPIDDNGIDTVFAGNVPPLM